MKSSLILSYLTVIEGLVCLCLLCLFLFSITPINVVNMLTIVALGLGAIMLSALGLHEISESKMILRRVWNFAFNYLSSIRKVWVGAWNYSQERYVQWSREGLGKKYGCEFEREYMGHIRHIGRQFASFVGSVGCGLDVGCGNGLINGETYREADYYYLQPTPSDTVIGLDPLKQEAEKPQWLTQITRGIGEALPFKNKAFDTITLATSLDHIENVAQFLNECRRVLKPSGALNIWSSCTKQPTRSLDHKEVFTETALKKKLSANGFTPVQQYIEAFSKKTDTVFLKCKTKSTRPSLFAMEKEVIGQYPYGIIVAGMIFLRIISVTTIFDRLIRKMGRRMMKK